jgi:hypothetical protein
MADQFAGLIAASSAFVGCFGLFMNAFSGTGSKCPRYNFFT